MSKPTSTVVAMRPKRRRKVVLTPESEALSLKELAFVEHYVNNGWNGTQAALKAGYATTVNSAANGACLLLRKSKIQEALRSRYRERHLTTEQILDRLGEIANANPADFLDKRGDVSLKKFRERGYLVKSRKLRRTTDAEGNTTEHCELEVHDPMSAMDKLLKVQGAYKESAPQLTVNASGPVQFVVRLNDEELP